MKLIIARHGEAGMAIDDHSRTLTPRGAADITAMCRIIETSGWQIDDIRYSPLVRTAQTAEIIANTLQQSGHDLIPVIREPSLAPGIDADSVMELFENYTISAVTVWVFHSPDVQILSSLLLGLPERAFYFPPGAMLALTLPKPCLCGRAMLVWKMTPEIMNPPLVVPVD